MSRKKLIHIHSNVDGKKPLSSSLEKGEIAVNYFPGKENLFIKNENNEIVDFSTTAQIDAKLAKKSNVGHNHDGTYLKNVKAVSGADINTVGTPSVTVNNGNGESTLTFHQLKGVAGKDASFKENGRACLEIGDTFIATGKSNNDGASKNDLDGGIKFNKGCVYRRKDTTNTNPDNTDYSKSFTKIADMNGKTGEQGPAGQDGTNGKDGQDGANGQDGTNGQDGAPGADGKMFTLKSAGTGCTETGDCFIAKGNNTDGGQQYNSNFTFGNIYWKKDDNTSDKGTNNWITHFTDGGSVRGPKGSTGNSGANGKDSPVKGKGRDCTEIGDTFIAAGNDDLDGTLHNGLKFIKGHMYRKKTEGGTPGTSNFPSYFDDIADLNGPKGDSITNVSVSDSNGSRTSAKKKHTINITGDGSLGASFVVYDGNDGKDSTVPGPKGDSITNVTIKDSNGSRTGAQKKHDITIEGNGQFQTKTFTVYDGNDGKNGNDGKDSTVPGPKGDSIGINYTSTSSTDASPQKKYEFTILENGAPTNRKFTIFDGKNGEKGEPGSKDALPLSGGTMTGPININSNKIYIKGDTIDGKNNLILSSNAENGVINVKSPIFVDFYKSDKDIDSPKYCGRWGYSDSGNVGWGLGDYYTNKINAGHLLRIGAIKKGSSKQYEWLDNPSFKTPLCVDGDIYEDGQKLSDKYQAKGSSVGGNYLPLTGATITEAFTLDSRNTLNLSADTQVVIASQDVRFEGGGVTVVSDSGIVSPSIEVNTIDSTNNRLTFLSGFDVQGDVKATGGFFDTSDARLKDFGEDIPADFERIKSIPKKYFSWKSDEKKEQHIGTSAQEVRKVYPELVNEDKNGKLSVDYAKLSVVALKAIDELHEENEILKERLRKIEEKLGL